MISFLFNGEFSNLELRPFNDYPKYSRPVLDCGKAGVYKEEFAVPEDCLLCRFSKPVVVILMLLSNMRPIPSLLPYF
jgi:hypothetical protein